MAKQITTEVIADDGSVRTVKMTRRLARELRQRATRPTLVIQRGLR